MANEIYDGTRVFTAADGGTAIFSDQNTFQDQMILGMEGRTRFLSPAMGGIDTAGSNWKFRCDTASPRPVWQEAVCTSVDRLIVPLPLRKNEYLVDIHVIILGSVNTPPAANKGEIGVYSTLFDTATPTIGAMVQVEDLGGADPWNVAGAYTLYSKVGMNLNASNGADDHYFLVIESHDDAAPGVCEYYGCKLVTRFHFGA